MGVYLTKPDKKKHSQDVEYKNFKYGICSMQGWRLEMEDKHLAIPNFYKDFSLFAIFDGHGSDETSKFCEKNFPQILKENKNFKDNKIKKGLEESFLELDNILQTEIENNKKYHVSGCTAILLLFNKTNYYIANVGDSRIILYKKNKKVISLSKDHKPDLISEQKRIIKAGGFINNGRVNGCLNLTRCLGDLQFKQNFNIKPKDQIISAFPEIVVSEFTGEEDFFLIGCDGIFEEKSNLEIFERICWRYDMNRFVKLSVILEDLFDWLLGKCSYDGIGCDNMSAILIKFS